MSVKGVIVAAGYGTRFLPITRAVPKEMLPIVDRPAIDLVVDELVGAGIREILVITSRRKKVLDDWFDVDKELEALFTREGAEAKLRAIRPPAASFTFVRQQEMSGTGHAILLAKTFAGADPVVVAYPDDLFGAPSCTAELIAAHERTGGSVLACKDLVGEDVSRYGVVELAGAPSAGGDLPVRRLVEKPPRDTEPSTLVSFGRYLFTPDVFAHLEAGLRVHPGGEYPHVHAIDALAAGGRLFARAVAAERYDTGTPLGYLQTVVRLAAEREDLGPEFLAWLRAYLGSS